jgi:SAM-dependent MidA family methyltransferase
MSTELPLPSAEAQAVSAALLCRIREAIRDAGGAIGFDRFMQMALYEPGLGYYSAGARKFGAGGDFVTAPEISGLFGQCLARQAAQVLAALGGGDMLEFGAGSGQLAVDVLTELDRLDCLPARYLVLEVSADLRERQRQRLAERLPALAPRVEWLDEMPAGFDGVVLGNEVLDAMPFHRLRKHDRGWGELTVVDGGDGLRWGEHLADPPPQLVAGLAAIEGSGGPLAAGYTTELSDAFEPWLRTLAAHVRHGAVILIDYGDSRAEYYRPDRRDGTLLCHYRHRAHGDPLCLVGLQDITASVDFTAVAEAAQDAGFDVAGYCTQAQWLLSLGITELADRETASDVERLHLAQQVKRLILPGEMGDRFKVLMLLRDLEMPSPIGFNLANSLHRL